MVKKCPPGVFCFDKMTLILIIFILIIVLVILNINVKIGKNKKKSYSSLDSSSYSSLDLLDNGLDDNNHKNNNNNNNINSNNNKNNMNVERVKIIKKPKKKIIVIEDDIDEYAFNNNSNKNMNSNIKLIDLDNRPRVDNKNQLSYWGYVNQHNGNRIMNPQLPPERSFEQTYGVPVNIPTRGYDGGYQQVGMLYKESVTSEDAIVGNNSESVILPLYGKPVHPGSNKWSYYTSSDKYQTVKIPLSYKGRKCDSQYGCAELYDDDIITVPPYNNNFKVKLYEYDKPKYIPYVY